MKYILPDVVAVHTPLDATLLMFGCDSVDITRAMYNSSMKEALEKTCLFANVIANTYGHDVIVITHMSESFEELSIQGVLDDLYEYTYILTCIHRNIVIGIENVTPIEKSPITDYKFRNGVLSDPVKLVEFLNGKNSENVEKQKFTNVFDVCHMIITIRMFEAVGLKAPSLGEMMRNYAKSCSYIHLANVKDFGLKPKQHGAGFINDEKYLEDILCMITESFEDAILCLEMGENSYYNPVNATHVKEYITKRQNKK